MRSSAVCGRESAHVLRRGRHPSELAFLSRCLSEGSYEAYREVYPEPGGPDDESDDEQHADNHDADFEVCGDSRADSSYHFPVRVAVKSLSHFL